MNAITYRPLAAADLERLGEIDRTERIETLYIQQGEQLVERAATFDVPPWSAEGDHEHSLAYLRAFCERHLAAATRSAAASDADIARAAGHTTMVVSATPSVHTVRFYVGCGFAPMAEPLPELYALEPEDVHLSKSL